MDELIDLATTWTEVDKSISELLPLKERPGSDIEVILRYDKKEHTVNLLDPQVKLVIGVLLNELTLARRSMRRKIQDQTERGDEE